MNKIERGKILLLNEEEVARQFTPSVVLDLVEKAEAEYSDGNAVNPIKLHLPLYPKIEGYINSMPAYLTRLNIAGMKFVAVYNENMKKYNVPVTTGTVILNEPETGIPYALMDGTYITAARTGASVGVMAKHLARKDSKVITVIGCGPQGLSSYIMIHTALPGIREVRAVDINPAAQERFIAGAREVFPEAEYRKFDSIQEACTGAEVIVVAATSPTPLLLDIELDPGATALCVEEDINNRYCKRFDKVIVDFEDCFLERVNADNKHHCELTGEIYEELLKESLDGEIGDVITGRIRGRESDDEKILAAPVGMGVTDIICAQYAFEKALEKGEGKIVDFLNL